MDLFLTVSGQWSLTRAITDRRGGPDARFSGHATFEGTVPTLDHIEAGTLTIGGTDAHATRRYRWDCTANGAAVYFDDGRFFHRFSVTGGKAEADHLCDADHYHVDYVFHGTDHWTTTYTVTGPRKDYIMLSDYRRIT